VEVKEGQVAAKVKVDIGGGNVITSAITVDAVKDLASRWVTRCAFSSRQPVS